MASSSSATPQRPRKQPKRNAPSTPRAPPAKIISSNQPMYSGAIISRAGKQRAKLGGIQGLAANVQPNSIQPAWFMVNGRRPFSKAHKAAADRLLTHSAADFERVAAFLVDPYTFRTVRWRSEFTPSLTAVANPWSKTTVPFLAGASAAAESALPATDMMAFFFRNPLCAMIYYDPNPTQASYGYNLYGSAPTTLDTPVAPTAGWVLGAGTYVTGVKTHLHTVYGVSSEAYSPHGQYWFAAGVGKGNRRFFFCNPGDEVNINITQTSAGTPSTALGADLWTPDGGINEGRLVSPTSAGAGTTTLTITMPTGKWGYYSFWLENGGGALTGLTVNWMTITGSSPTFCHQALPGIAAQFPAVKSIKITAAKFTFTNTAQPLNRAGTVVSIQAPQGEHWNNYMGTSGSKGVSLLMSQAGEADMEAREGIDQFLKPTQPSDWDYIDCFDVDTVGMTDSYWPLENQSSFLVFGSQIPNTADAQKGYWTAAWGIEYQTEDIWRDIDYPTVSYQACKDAALYLSEIPSTHGNPVHIAELLSKIRAGAKAFLNGVIEYAPHIVRGASAIASALG